MVHEILVRKNYQIRSIFRKDQYLHHLMYIEERFLEIIQMHRIDMQSIFSKLWANPPLRYPCTHGLFLLTRYYEWSQEELAHKPGP